MLSHYCLDIIRSERQGWWPSVGVLLLTTVLGLLSVSASVGPTTKPEHPQVASPDLFTIRTSQIVRAGQWTIGLIYRAGRYRDWYQVNTILYWYQYFSVLPWTNIYWGPRCREGGGRTEGVINTKGSESLIVWSDCHVQGRSSGQQLGLCLCPLSPCHQYYYQDIQFCSDLFHWSWEVFVSLMRHDCMTDTDCWRSLLLSIIEIKHFTPQQSVSQSWEMYERWEVRGERCFVFNFSIFIVWGPR